MVAVGMRTSVVSPKLSALANEVTAEFNGNTIGYSGHTLFRGFTRG